MAEKRRKTSEKTGRKAPSIKQKSIKKRNPGLNLILIGVLALIVVVALVGGIIKQARGGNGELLTSPDDDGSRIQAVADNIALNEAEVKTEITAVIRQYRAALASGDVDALKKIFNTKDIKNDNTYIAMSTIITGYRNTEVWIRPGLDAASRIVFIYDDLTLAGFDVLIPNVSVVYVRAAADGTFFIERGLYNEETMSFQYDRKVTDRIDALKNDSEISELIRSTNQRFSEVCESNPDFKAYIDMLNASVAAAAAEAETSDAVLESEVRPESTAETESQDGLAESVTDQAETSESAVMSESVAETKDPSNLAPWERESAEE